MACRIKPSSGPVNDLAEERPVPVTWLVKKHQILTSRIYG